MKRMRKWLLTFPPSIPLQNAIKAALDGNPARSLFDGDIAHTLVPADVLQPCCSPPSPFAALSAGLAWAPLYPYYLNHFLIFRGCLQTQTRTRTHTHTHVLSLSRARGGGAGEPLQGNGLQDLYSRNQPPAGSNAEEAGGQGQVGGVSTDERRAGHIQASWSSLDASGAGEAYLPPPESYTTPTQPSNRGQERDAEGGVAVETRAHGVRV